MSSLIDLKNLPQDAASLRKIIRQAEKVIREKDFFIGKLQHQLAEMERHRFGKKSEKYEPGQMFLFATQLPPVHVPEVVAEEDDEPKEKPRRRKIDGALPRRRVEHTLPEEELACIKCFEPMEKFGEEVSEEYEYIPASLHVKQSVRFKYACKSCEGSVKVARMPVQIIPKGQAGPGLLSHVLVGKFADHLPLYRQSGIFARHGVDLPRSTLTDWVMGCADLLKPIVEQMETEILESKAIHTDDTVIPVLDRKLKRTRTGRLWVYIGDESRPYTVFRYSPNRKGEHPQEFLKSFQGYIHADAYGGYDQIFDTGGATEVACWAHARRKFFESKETDPLQADTALGFIRRLYAVEREIKILPREERKKRRQGESRPVLESFKIWIDGLKVLPKSPMGEASTYALNHWEALNTYLDDGDLSIDNNPAEQAIRPIAVGRKNWLFAGSDRGGHAAAVITSLIATCRRHGVEPYAYLHDALTVMADARELGSDSAADFTPLTWKNMRAAVEVGHQKLGG